MDPVSNRPQTSGQEAFWNTSQNTLFGLHNASITTLDKKILRKKSNKKMQPASKSFSSLKKPLDSTIN